MAEVASAFGVDTSTLWRWTRAFISGGVLALASERRGPKGPSKLTTELKRRINGLDRDGLSLRQIAAQTVGGHELGLPPIRQDVGVAVPVDLQPPAQVADVGHPRPVPT